MGRRFRAAERVGSMFVSVRSDEREGVHARQKLWRARVYEQKKFKRSGCEYMCVCVCANTHTSVITTTH